MTRFYKFKPKEDITAKEIADILAKLSIFERLPIDSFAYITIEEFPEEVKRHFPLLGVE